MIKKRLPPPPTHQIGLITTDHHLGLMWGLWSDGGANENWLFPRWDTMLFGLVPVFCAMCSLCSALPRILSSPHNSQLSSNFSCSGEHSCNSFSSLSFCHGCHPTPVMLLSRLCCVIFSESCDWHDQYFDCSLNFHRPNNSVGRWYIAFIFLQIYPFYENYTCWLCFMCTAGSNIIEQK